MNAAVRLYFTPGYFLIFASLENHRSKPVFTQRQRQRACFRATPLIYTGESPATTKRGKLEKHGDVGKFGDANVFVRGILKASDTSVA